MKSAFITYLNSGNLRWSCSPKLNFITSRNLATLPNGIASLAIRVFNCQFFLIIGKKGRDALYGVSAVHEWGAGASVKSGCRDVFNLALNLGSRAVRLGSPRRALLHYVWSRDVIKLGRSYWASGLHVNQIRLVHCPQSVPPTHSLLVPPLQCLTNRTEQREFSKLRFPPLPPSVVRPSEGRTEANLT